MSYIAHQWFLQKTEVLPNVEFEAPASLIPTEWLALEPALLN